MYQLWAYEPHRGWKPVTAPCGRSEAEEFLALWQHCSPYRVEIRPTIRAKEKALPVGAGRTHQKECPSFYHVRRVFVNVGS
jgi:hypothetical protein